MLVNNAGGPIALGYFVNTDTSCGTSCSASTWGVLAVTHAVLPGMHERGGGAIVNVASEAGRVGSPGSATYSAAKAGVIGFTKAIARESARYGVRCNAVAPGPIETPLLNAAAEHFGEIGPRLKQGMINATAVRRSGPARRGRRGDRLPGLRRRLLRDRSDAQRERRPARCGDVRTGRLRPGAGGRVLVEDGLLTDVEGTLADAVLSTPGMISMMEWDATLLYAQLPNDRATVGFEVCVKHVGGAREGALCTVTARLSDVIEERKLRFDVEVREGAHDRRRHARAARGRGAHVGWPATRTPSSASAPPSSRRAGARGTCPRTCFPRSYVDADPARRAGWRCMLPPDPRTHRAPRPGARPARRADPRGRRRRGPVDLRRRAPPRDRSRIRSSATSSSWPWRAARWSATSPASASVAGCR